MCRKKPISFSQFQGGVVPQENYSGDYSDLNPDLLDLVRGLQASLSEKQIRQQFQVRDAEPSKLELALAQRRAKASGRVDSSTHPQLLASVVESADSAISSETWTGVIL
ncbi:MAG: hypothetical protein ABL878_07850, partial [Burkholderiales bacterium]